MTANHPSAETVSVEGRWDARFSRLRDAFAANFEDLGEVGAALCVIVGGDRVIDIWGGHTDAAHTAHWQRDTLVNTYSVGKGVLAVLFLAAVERGLIELDEPVARLWPEFAARGKGDISVRVLLCHQAGLPAVRERLAADAMLDWSRMTTALAAQSPYWEPGATHGYHVNTYGYLVGELIHRATGLAVGEALAQLVTGPTEAEFYYGVPDAALDRVATIIAPQAQLTTEAEWAAAFPPTGDAEHDRMIWHAYFNPSGISGIGSVNTVGWRRAAIPSTNGHATARGVAKLYAALIGDRSATRPWPGSALLAEATSIHSDGEDRMLGRPSRFGLGFQLSQPSRPLGLSQTGFGHYGYGGSLGFADPEAAVAFGYLMNRPGDRWQTPRTRRLIDALYECLGSTLPSG